MLARSSDPAAEPAVPPVPQAGPVRLVLLARERWRLVGAIVVIVTAIAFFYSHFVLMREPVFRAAATLDISPSRAEMDYGNALARGSALQSAALLTQTYAEYGRSRPVVEAIAAEYLDLHPDALNAAPQGLGIRRTIRILDQGGPAVRDPRLLFIDNLQKAVDINTVEGTHLLRISVSWDNPVTAAWFANKFAKRLIDQAGTRANGPTDQLHQTLDAKLAEARALLNARQIEAAQTRASLGVADIQKQKQSLIEERLAEEGKLTDERAQMAASSTQVGVLERQANGPLSSATAAVDQALALERPRLAGLQRSAGQRAARVGQLQGQLARLTQSETRLGVLDREIEGLQATVTALTERTNNVALDTLAEGPPVRVVEAARPPLVRDSPRVLTNTVFGFAGGCALAALFLLVLPAGTTSTAIAAPRPRRFGGFDGRIYPGRLKPPAAGCNFTPAESADIRRRLSDWLAGPLSSAGGTFYVLATGRDAEAVAVYNLLAAFLTARGEAVNAESEAAEGDQLVRTRSRGLIYCGGLDESGEIPPPTGGEEDLVLVVPRRTSAAELEDLHARLAESGWNEPYLIHLDR
jgi:uncharacterized protein involved in exopolysaccharide biosynthesis